MFCFFRVMSGDWAHAAFARRVGVREKRMTTVERGAVRKENDHSRARRCTKRERGGNYLFPKKETSVSVRSLTGLESDEHSSISSAAFRDLHMSKLKNKKAGFEEWKRWRVI
jgi:hypothetical protein